MNLKFQQTIRAIFLFLPAVPAWGQGAWSDSPVGRCYASISAYLVETYGEDYRNDENLLVRPVLSDGKSVKGLTWFIDASADVNVTRVLFVKRNSLVCATLYVPASSVVRANFGAHGELPRTIESEDTPPPTLDANKVIYTLAKDRRIYFPSKCFKLNEEKKSEREVSCELAFSDPSE
jgi:hypothetical protein